jgi:hypothetical protein
MSGATILLLFQPSTMSTAQMAAASFLACYAGQTHALWPPTRVPLGRWDFGLCRHGPALRTVETGSLGGRPRPS